MEGYIVSNRWMMLALVPALILVMSATAFAQSQASSTGAENAAEHSAAAQSQYDGDCTEGQYEDGSTNHEDSAAHSQYDETGHESSAAHCGDEPTGHEESAAHQGSGEDQYDDDSGDDQYEED